MQAIKQKILENKGVLAVVIGILILVIIIAVLMDSRGNRELSENTDQLASTDNLSGDLSSNTISNKDSKGGQNLSSASTAPNFTMVKYAVLANPDLFDYLGEKNSCEDEISWVSEKVAPTKAVLNASLREMFNSKLDLGYVPGNFVQTQKVSFNNATIENGVAKIYLSGTVNLSTDCAEARFKNQLEKTALQFNTVKSVQIILNGEVL